MFFIDKADLIQPNIFYHILILIIELDSGYRSFFENQNEACPEDHRVAGVPLRNDLSKEECLRRCDSNRYCKYASLNAENECALYRSCRPRILVKKLNQTVSVFEKGSILIINSFRNNQSRY